MSEQIDENNHDKNDSHHRVEAPGQEGNRKVPFLNIFRGARPEEETQMEARIISTTSDENGWVWVQTQVVFTKEEWDELNRAKHDINEQKVAAIKETIAHFLNWG